MRLASAALALAITAFQASAQTRLQLRFELVEDVFRDGNGNGRGASRVAYTLKNLDTKPLPKDGWALYFNGGRRELPGGAPATASIESLAGDLRRLVPGAGFAGLPPGESVRFEFLTPFVPNIGFAPAGPYIVFDEDPAKGHAIRDYTAVPFTRAPRPGGDPRVVTPEAQYALNEAVRELPAEALPRVFPTPLRLEPREGELRLRSLPTVAAAPDLKAEAELAAVYLRPHFPAKPLRKAGAPTLRLETGPVEGQTSPEAYELVLDPAEGIRIVGNSAAGVFYGIQSLRSLLPPVPAHKELSLPALRIVDAPRFAYRGLHLDVARNFQPKASVIEVLELMARYKLNALHFHLTDDEGWRLAIDGLPELTRVGARRGHTLDSADFLQPAYGSGPDVDRPFGSGFYSRTDYVEIVRHAAARKIEVIPEIEMPGHARAAIKAMEARARALRAAGDEQGAARFLLSDPDDRSVYTSAQDYHDNVMNPALPSTYAFVEQVVEELVALHREAGVPLDNLHMGGDEVPAGVWEGSPVAQAFLRANGLSSVDELWYFFYGRVEQMLKRRGIPLSGWEEIGLRKTRLHGKTKFIPNPGFADRGWRTYVWNNVPGDGAEDLAYRLANGGYKVVLCPVTNLYFDLAYNKNPEERGLNWGGYVDVDKPFQFVPLDYYRSAREDRRGNPVDASVFVGKDRLTDYGRANILGIQGQLWSETLSAPGRLDHMLVPKLFGLAERAWAPDPEWAREGDEAKAASLYQQAWSEFANVLGRRELPRLAHERPGLLYRIPTPGLRVQNGRVRANLQLPGFALRYTTDGSEPTAKSAEVAGPIEARGRVRVAAFDANGRRGHVAEILVR